MASVDSTTALPTTPRKPEQVAVWLYDHLSSYRGLLGLLVIAGLTIVSIAFNYQLGKITASDPLSKQLLPLGFALLDGGCLFLAGYVGIKSRSLFLKTIAWGWFLFLLSLSLWACASFTVAVDAQINKSSTDQLIDAKHQDLEAAQKQIKIWQNKLANTSLYNRAYQRELDQITLRRDGLLSEISALRRDNPPPSLAIYYKINPLLPWQLSPEQLASIVRFVWSAALVVTPLLLTLLVSAGIETSSLPNPSSIRKKPELTEELPEKTSKFTKKQRSSGKFPSAVPTANCSTEQENLSPVFGNNQHTPVDYLKALDATRSWLSTQEGRVNRNQITSASGVRNRKTIDKVIAKLIEERLLMRMGNGQLRAHRASVLKVLG